MVLLRSTAVSGDLLITKGSVSYLSLIAKAYCREGHASGPDFELLEEEMMFGGGELDSSGLCDINVF